MWHCHSDNPQAFYSDKFRFLFAGCRPAVCELLRLLVWSFLRVSDHRACILVAAKRAKLRFSEARVGTVDVAAVSYEFHVLVDPSESQNFRDTVAFRE
jgi:hypothetical protein